jgi:hypothetical protein
VSSSVIVPMQKIVKSTLALLALAIAAGLLTSLINQPVGYGLLIGSAISLGFFLVTAVVALRTATTSPEKLGLVVLSSWLVKMVVLIALLAWLQNQNFYDRVALFLALVLTTVVTLVADALISIKTRVPYVD